MNGADAASLASIQGVSLRYGRKTLALDGIDLDLPTGRMIGLIGPDGVGKSSLLSLISGSRKIQEGQIHLLGGDMRRKAHRDEVCPKIAYMPQGLGKNLYFTLSVEENLQFFARLFGHNREERRRRIDELTTSTGLKKFLDRPAGKLSGGMKQKLGLCCSLIHDPDLLILDEPTTGVDPLSRNQFWDLIGHIRKDRPQMSVIVATAYMEEADRFDWLVAMDDGRILTTGTPSEIHERTGTTNLEEAFIQLLPEEKKKDHREVRLEPFEDTGDEDIAIEANDLTKRFGDFVAVDRVNFRIRRGEIFGFLGSNGCGKSTTMKMLTGLLDATEGNARLFGHEVDPKDLNTRRQVGYMSQAFSLYSELSVEQNLVLHARLFHVPENGIPARVAEMIERFDLQDVRTELPESLPLGIRQRLSLSVAMVHKPSLLILDEPTSGVDPIARDNFWQLMIELARKDKVTIFISTHFMNEAGRCDRISLMHAGKVLVSDTPDELVRKQGAANLEEVFIHYLEEAEGSSGEVVPDSTPRKVDSGSPPHPSKRGFSLQRALSYSWRESLELQRDPVRATLALLGTVILMFIMGYGINMDVEDIRYAVLDRDQTTLSENYALNLSGSRYFVERPPISSYEEMDRRMRSGELTLAIEIPPGFAKNVSRGASPQVAAWVDGSLPMQAETAGGYVQGMHQNWMMDHMIRDLGQRPVSKFIVEDRYRYNPDVKSLIAMVPGVIPLLLMMIPSIVAALSVVREKELGSILNLYVTPVTRAEFLLGKQLPYIGLGMFNFFLLSLLAVTLFGVPLTGSFLTLTTAALLYVASSTGMGLLASTFTRSQIAAMFVTMLGTMMPCLQFSGLITPVSSLEGAGAFMGRIYPASHFLDISRGVFSKALGFADLHLSLWSLALSVPVIVGAAILLLKKQEA